MAGVLCCFEHCVAETSSSIDLGLHHYSRPPCCKPSDRHFGEMCMPLSLCCCCIPLRTGVRLIALLLSALELALMVYNIVLVNGNTEALLEVLDDEIEEAITAKSELTWKVLGIAFGYSILLLLNVLLLIGTFVNNRWLIIPWLIVNLLIIIALYTSVPLIIIWFLVIQSGAIKLFSFLALIPFITAKVLLYFWAIVNGYFVKMRMDEVKPYV